MLVEHPFPLTQGARGLWLELHAPDARDQARVLALTGLALPDAARVGEIEFSSRVRQVGQALYLNVPRFDAAGGGRPSSLAFVLAPGALVTVHDTPVEALDAVSAGCDDRPMDSAADLFMRIAGRIIDAQADRLEALEAQVADCTHHLFETRHTGRELDRLLRTVGSLGHRLEIARNTQQGLLRIVSHLDEAPPDWFGHEAVRQLRLAHRDLLSLVDFAQPLANRIDFLLDGVLGLINMDQNEVMKVMAVASVVGIAPMVLVGVWGMNFVRMPELASPWGYPLALAAIAASILAPLLWFRRRGWLRATLAPVRRRPRTGHGPSAPRPGSRASGRSAASQQ